MTKINRRKFLFRSSGAALGSLLVSGLAAEGDQGPQSDSGLVTSESKPLKYASIPGFLSEAQISPHHKAHYGGALRGYVDLDQKLQAAAPGSKDAVASMIRARVSKGNSVLLHEVYFDHMAAKPPQPGSALRSAITSRFGSIDKWTEDFVQTAGSAAGWALLVQHSVNGSLYNVASDEHSMGVLWMATPLIALDVYEHAYYVDYTNRKAEYVQGFMQHIDWDSVQANYRGA